LTTGPSPPPAPAGPIVSAQGPLLVAGRTCGEVAVAERLAVLVDGEAYFDALACSLAAAQREVLIAGWDIDPTTTLWRGLDRGPPVAEGPPWRPGTRLPPQLGPLLDELCRRRLRLRVQLLAWDFGTMFAVRRGFVPVYHLDWGSHRRVRVRLDSEHPFGSAVHYKAATVDDAVAYVGGIDLARGRWDRRGHDAIDPLRVDADGHSTLPWHDQQVLVSGPAAWAVGRIVRERWQRATHSRLSPPRLPSPEVWPSHLAPDLQGVRVGLARTEPAWEERPQLQEIERLYQDIIGRARRCVYIENQYLTAHSIRTALATRLAERDGPEVIIVTSLRSTGLLEQASMDVGRAGFVHELQAADHHGRLRVLSPQTGAGQPVKVHSKCAVVDDRYLVVGSANLANRSMGMDVELDLCVEAWGPGEEAVRAFLPTHRDGLLAEHLAVPIEDLRRQVHARGSLGAAIDALRGGPEAHTLVPLELGEHAGALLAGMGDPEQAVDLADWATKAVPPGLPRSIFAMALRAGAGLLLFGALEGAWHGLPGDPATSTLSRYLEPTGLEPLAVLVMVAALLGSSIVPFPMGAVMALAGFAFGARQGYTLAVLGGVGGALVGWMVGRALGRSRVRVSSVPRLSALSRRLSQGGILSVAELRILPRHTFAEVNLVAGASGVPLRDFLVGTALGVAPGALLLTGAGALVGHAMRHPGPLSVPGAVLVVVLGSLGLVWLWRRQELLPGR